MIHHGDGERGQVITAAERFDAHRAAIAKDDDRHRPVTADDVHDAPADGAAAATQATGRDGGAVRATGVVEEPDLRVERGLREVAAREPRQQGEDQLQVPEPDAVADTRARVRRTIREREAREAYDQQAEHDQWADQLARRHSDDHAGTPSPPISWTA